MRLTDCRPAKKTYPHLREAAGWENHDGDLFAQVSADNRLHRAAGRLRHRVRRGVVGGGADARVDGDDASRDREIRYEGCGRLEYRETVER